MWGTGDSGSQVSLPAGAAPARAPLTRGAAGGQRGFTFLEILVAITIAGLVLALSVPASARLYRSMQYREAVRETVAVLTAARHQAVAAGRAQDVRVDPRNRELRLNGRVTRLPDGVNLVVQAARELNEREVGVIRFYPEGGSSGGGIDIALPGRAGVRIDVDWLVGRVSQEPHAPR
jgi:general secretion pathway protein H